MLSNIILHMALVSSTPTLIEPQNEYIYASEKGNCIQRFIDIDDEVQVNDKVLSYCDAKGKHKTIVASFSGSAFQVIKKESFDEGELLVGIKPNIIQGVLADNTTQFQVGSLSKLCIDGRAVEVTFVRKQGNWMFFQGELAGNERLNEFKHLSMQAMHEHCETSGLN
ncbi:hypothetical protein [Pseudoalteromonas xiamenensis]